MKLSSAVFALSVLLAGSAAAEAAKLRIATEGAYPPFNYVKDGQLGGFDVDLAKAICADLGDECTYVAVPWDNIIDGLEKNDYDLIVASMANTPERAARVAFSESYYRSHSGFVGDPEKIEDSTPEALAGKRISVQKDTLQSGYVHRFYPKSEILEAPGTMDALQMVVDGRADVTLIDAIQVLDWMQSQEGEKFGYIGDPVTGEYFQSSSHIAARKDQAALIDDVNASIKRLRLNGTYDRINANYFPFSIY
ncbi:substrate-binding periplasmic protein [Aureimonas leprariae]|uniref:Transporter substrate-binding domain-containing protein n=1 Tax=Plantimonas leprariae TaxID=2615207 RepID=A0A7V7TZ49_9HYPH|nr:transporter substrate-binding domain-containing protein [Aureimonas leprariae]KAB0678800.1 transporter substrate-binding domain-containing protein [Aureimonas leprariae]